jgi:hypothetical protein
METVVIKSKEDIENIITNYETYLSSDKEFNISFLYNKPFILYIDDDNYQGMVNCDMLQSIIYLQKCLYRVYSYYNYGYVDLNRLTKKEKKNLEIKVKIKDGSVVIEAFTNEKIIEIIKTMVNKMNSREILILICVLTVGLTTSYFIRWFFKYKINKTDKDTENEREKKIFEVFSKMSDDIKDVAFLRGESEMMYKNILSKSSSFQKGIKINDYEITQDDIKNIMKNEKNEKIPIRLDGRYEITEVAWIDEIDNVNGSNRLELKYIDNTNKYIKQYDTINVYLYKDFSTNCDIDTIELKLNSKNRIFYFEINANLISGKVVEATIFNIHHAALSSLAGDTLAETNKQ